MDGSTVAFASLDELDQQGEGRSDLLHLHSTGGSAVKVEGCSDSWRGGAEALACKEASGTSTAADSPPETSPVAPADAGFPAAEVSVHAAEEEQTLAETTACDHSAAPQQQLPPSASPASASDAQDEGPIDAVAGAAATVAVEALHKSEKLSESHSHYLLRSSGQGVSKAWEGAIKHAAAAASATASRVATTDFSALKVTANPLLAAASYIGLGASWDSSSADTEGNAICKKAESGAATAPAENVREANSHNSERGSLGCEEAPPPDSEGSASSRWLLGRLRLPGVTQWLCSTNVGCDRPQSCTVAVADTETELEGSEAEAAAQEHLATVSRTYPTAAAAAGAGSLQGQDARRQEELVTADCGFSCTPSTPKATRVVKGLLDARKQERATVAGEGGAGCCTGCCTAEPVKTPEGFEPVLTSLEETEVTAIACEHCLVPDLGGERGRMNDEGSESAQTATDRLQQQQKQKLWESLRSTMATSSRRSVDVVQQAATTAASAAGAATRALDALVVPLFGTCMHPTTHERVGSQHIVLEEENCPDQAGGNAEGPEELLHVNGREDEHSQANELACGASETNSRSLLTELQRRQQALAEAVRNRSTNFFQHSVALTSSSSFSEARYHLAEIVDTGGPEVGRHRLSVNSLSTSICIFPLPRAVKE